MVSKEDALKMAVANGYLEKFFNLNALGKKVFKKEVPHAAFALVKILDDVEFDMMMKGVADEQK